LETAGLEVDDISLRAPTLDEVFLALTGRGADVDTAPQSQSREGVGSRGNS
jgi:ABC-2 type transport system ATP-binding protein